MAYLQIDRIDGAIRNFGHVQNLVRLIDGEMIDAADDIGQIISLIQKYCGCRVGTSLVIGKSHNKMEF